MCGTAVVCSVVLAIVGKTPLLVQEKAQFGELIDWLRAGKMDCSSQSFPSVTLGKLYSSPQAKVCCDCTHLSLVYGFVQ